MKASRNNKLLVFVTIDGWGVSSFVDNNAIRKANIPGFKDLVANYPATVVTPPGESVSQNYRLLGLGKKDHKSDVANLNLSKIISRANLNQLKIAGSCDFPLISVFFDNSDERFLNEDWIIFDDKPHSVWSFFSRNTLVDQLVKHIKSNRYNFIMSSLSNISRVVLQGDFSSTVSAVEDISLALNKISQAVLSVGGTLVISSTYGGAEDVYNIGTGMANKKRSTNPVPLIIVDRKYQGRVIGASEAPNNDLSLLSSSSSYLDIAPTILDILNLKIPEDMEGKSLVQ